MMEEKLAEYSHNAWAGWMKYMFSKCSFTKEGGTLIIPKWAVQRWSKQARTKYQDLTEGEKNSDRDEAKKIMEIVKDVRSG